MSSVSWGGVVGVHLVQGVSLRGCSVLCTEGTEPLLESAGSGTSRGQWSWVPWGFTWSSKAPEHPANAACKCIP